MVDQTKEELYSKIGNDMIADCVRLHTMASDFGRLPYPQQYQQLQFIKYQAEMLISRIQLLRNARY